MPRTLCGQVRARARDTRSYPPATKELATFGDLRVGDRAELAYVDPPGDVVITRVARNRNPLLVTVSFRAPGGRDEVTADHFRSGRVYRVAQWEEAPSETTRPNGGRKLARRRKRR